jgi:hypothetical protein
MPRKIKNYDRADLIDVALPNHASTYTVISHESVMDLSAGALQDAGFSITSENYRATHDGNIASAIYTLNFGDDPELSMMFAWSNSYNKQMRFKCGIGAIHNLNNTSLVCGDMGSWARKHTGAADTETEKTIKEQIELAKMYYNQLCSDKEEMKNIILNKRKQAQLLGILFAEHDILTTEQASLIRQQMSRPTHTYENNSSLWAFYNYVTLALQQSHPKTWMEDQRVLHWFISDAFKFDKVDEPIVDPNQVDLEDMIAEVEAEEETFADAIYVTDIEWETDEEDADLPKEVTLDKSVALDAIADYLSDKYGFVVKSYISQNAEVIEDEAEEETTVQELVDKAVANSNDDTGEEIVEVTEDEVADQLYGVNNDPEEVIVEVTPEIEKVNTIEEQIAEDEATELIKGQEAIDQQIAQKEAADNSNREETFSTFELNSDDGDDDVDSGDVDFNFA